MKISKQEEQIIAQFINDSNNNLFGNIVLIESDFCLSEFLIVEQLVELNIIIKDNHRYYLNKKAKKILKHLE